MKITDTDEYREALRKFSLSDGVRGGLIALRMQNDDIAHVWTIPEHLREGMVRYVLFGIEPGQFLQAVIQNDFLAATVRADEESAQGLRKIALFLANNVPAQCLGSKENMRLWIECGGLVGKRLMAERAAA